MKGILSLQHDVALMPIDDESVKDTQEELLNYKREHEMKRRYIDNMRQTLQQKLQEAQELAQQFDDQVTN